MVPPGGSRLVFTPLAPHGGPCPPLVPRPPGRPTIQLDPGHGGGPLEADGQIAERVDPLGRRIRGLSLRPDHATLVMLGGEEHLIAGLRRRRVLMDSPRVLARDDREAAAALAGSRDQT